MLPYFAVKFTTQSCINALHEAGITNNYLNLLYIENKKAHIAVKINNKQEFL